MSRTRPPQRDGEAPAAPDVPPAWARAAGRLAAAEPATVLVLGAPDTGKSSFCDALARHLLAAGRGVAVVDADVGQKDIGPPATIGLGYPAAGRPLAATPAAELAFVGATDPLRRMTAHIAGTLRLAVAAEAPFVVVDTTGLVRGPGLRLKTAKIDALRPDAVVALARGGELEAVLAACRHLPVIRLRPSRRARRRSRAERAAARRRAFQAYFAGARPRRLALDRVAVHGTALLSGRPLADFPALYAENTAAGRLVVGPQPGADTGRARVLPAGFERGLLCGLADGRGRDLGLGLVERIDFARRRLHYRSPVPARAVGVVKLGERCAELNAG